MGAQFFMTKAAGPSAKDAFNTAVRDARHLHGFEGYSGSIAEKTSFKQLTHPAGLTSEQLREWALSKCDEPGSPIEDKWGPAGCVYLGKDEFLFFGWASS